jgi:pimeloyl-ACP methyl ester carboxylesterase
MSSAKKPVRVFLLCLITNFALPNAMADAASHDATAGPHHPHYAARHSVRLVTEEAIVNSPRAGLKIYVRNKHPQRLRRFRPERTLVFVHGATYPASTSFDLELGGLSWMDAIARRGFDVYLLDLPGYGASTRPPAMDQSADAAEPIENTADAVRDYAAVVDWVLTRRHLARLDAMGWSWGTTIVAGFAAEQPAKVNRLVLYAPVWVPETASPPPAETPKLGAYRMVTREAALQRWLNGVPEDKQANLIPRDWFDRWQKATWATDPKAATLKPPALRAPNGVVQDFQNFWSQGKPTFDPAEITAPTLMIQAEWDHDTPPRRSQGLFPLLTKAPMKEYVLIGEGTHTIMMEKNRMLLFRAVQTFLEDNRIRR